MTNQNWALRAQGVSKKFGLTLKQSMRHGLGDIAKKFTFRSTHSEILRPGEFWAVKDVNFELHPGEAMAIMGVNGSGKTTLLRILSGVYAPDAGKIQAKGRLGSLIAAGAGFAPMLSGRENVYVNGSLLGLTTREINGLMDEIIAFAELGQFIDLPVKNYSSGMYVRLGFAIAALSRPDVLLMDEVLAVGDLNFQKKCYERILRLKRQGTAIILVSHSPGAIWSVCDRGVFMDKGEVKLVGSAEDVIRAYDDQNARNASASTPSEEPKKDGALAAEYGHKEGGTGDVVCHAVRLLSASSDQEQGEFEFRQPMIIEADIEVKTPQRELLVRYTIDAVHYRFIATLDNYEQGLQLPQIAAGNYVCRVAVDRPNFRPGAYTLNVGITTKHLGIHLYYRFAAARFVVKNPTDIFLYADPNAVMHLDSRFTFEPVTRS
jgi:lipopolysaccharide transport system ATP-binding protein